MNKKNIFLVIGIFFVILFLNFLSAVDITTCQTLNSPNTIYVLQKGEIIERGSHQQLLNKEGVYYDLYKLQDK